VDIANCTRGDDVPVLDLTVAAWPAPLKGRILKDEVDRLDSL
jgi:hypothetical protein